MLAGVNRTLKLLLFSTDDQFCAMVRSFLQHLGFSVFTCSSADRAERQFLRRCDIDLWLVDVEALGIEGLYVATKVRDLHSEVPIVLISGVHRDNSIEHLLVRNWISVRKPIPLPDLLATIHHALSAEPGMPATKPKHDGKDFFETSWLNRLIQIHSMN
jgi:two-component system, chemotaxis family, chemotaxis protein CheY